jgi:hypothetical protein
MRRQLVIYDFAPDPSCTPLNFLIYEENLILFFISVLYSVTAIFFFSMVHKKVTHYTRYSKHNLSGFVVDFNRQMPEIFWPCIL